MTGLPDVLESCRRVVERAGSLRLDTRGAGAWAAAQEPGSLLPPAGPPELSIEEPPEPCANLVLLLDCLNFCFWSDEPWSVEFRGRTWTRTFALYAGVLRAVESDRTWLTAERWAGATEADLAGIFRGRGRIPRLRQRREVLNETGRCLLERFGGRFATAVERAGRRARPLALLLAGEFPSFADAPTHRGQTVALLKRAQLCAADLHHAWTGRGDEGLAGLDELTVFADYRLPQYLRHIGVIRLESTLAARIDAGEEIPAGCEQEVELRAATVVGGDLLRRALAEVGHAIPAWRLDYVLWERSHDPDITIPHHRTRTIYY